MRITAITAKVRALALGALVCVPAGCGSEAERPARNHSTPQARQVETQTPDCYEQVQSKIAIAAGGGELSEEARRSIEALRKASKPNNATIQCSSDAEVLEMRPKP